MYGGRDTLERVKVRRYVKIEEIGSFSGGGGPIGRSSRGKDLVTKRREGVEKSTAPGASSPAAEALIFCVVVTPAQETRTEQSEEGKELGLGNTLVRRAVDSCNSEGEMGGSYFHIRRHKGVCGETRNKKVGNGVTDK